jgi:hypothetical protein
MGNLLIEFRLVCNKCFNELEFEILDAMPTKNYKDIVIKSCQECQSKLELEARKKFAKEIGKFIIEKKL